MTGEEQEDKFIKLNNQFNKIEDRKIFRFIPDLKKILNNYP